MKHLRLFILALCALFVGGLRDTYATANAEGTAGVHKHEFTKLADAAWTYQHCLVMAGTDADHVNLADGSTVPVGSTDDSPVAAQDPIQVNILNQQTGTRLFTSAASIATGMDVYCSKANPGYIVSEPGVAGTWYLIGRTVGASVETSDAVYQTEVETCLPRKTIILAALTSAQNATTAASDLATSEALANALQTSYNALQADVAALTAALATGGVTIKHL
jgi:hypothetical protein